MIERNIKEMNQALAKLNIGIVLDVQPVKAGIVNGTYNVTASQGNYIVRHLKGYNPNSRYSNAISNLRYGVIEYLASRSFPYEIPICKKDSNGQRVIAVEGKYFEAYKKIEGEMTYKQNESQMAEQAKALAQYHSTVAKQDFGHEEIRVKSLDKILEDFEQIKSGNISIPNTSVNQLNLNNMPIYAQFVQEVRNKRDLIPKDNILLHGDFHSGNMIYRGNSLVGILDFDNVKYGPRIFDVAHAAPTDDRFDKFIETYNRDNSLSIEERNAIRTVQAALALERIAYFARTPKDEDAQANVFKHLVNKDIELQKRLSK